MVSEKLLPCPFCGSNETGLFRPSEYLTGANNRDWYIQCFGCNIETVEYLTMDEAIAAWNTRAPADCKLADGDGKDCVLLDDHEGGCLSYDPKEIGVRLMSALGHVENCRAHGRITDAGFAAIRSALLIADRELSRLRAPADLRSALEAETIERCAKVAEEVWGDGPNQSYDNGATADGWNMASNHIAEAIRALVPTKEPAA